jgi:hypothetical protein
MELKGIIGWRNVIISINAELDALSLLKTI